MNKSDSPQALKEVWEWKERVYLEIKDKNSEEKRHYFHQGLLKAVKLLEAKLVKNPDGSYFIE